MKKTSSFKILSTGSPTVISLPTVSAGFPSPADDYLEKKLDLNEILVRNKAATFFVRAQGDSMSESKISSGDVLIVDRSIKAKNNNVIIANFNGNLVVKKIKKTKKKTILYSDNPHHSSITISEDSTFEIWGVVTYIIHRTKN